MINSILGFEYVFDLRFFQKIFLVSILGLYFRILIYQIVKESWIKSKSQNLLFILLPAIGMVITSSISNNIALSLGMVGALSIVRFRTPVKNPFELIVYFFLITLGIVMSVDESTAINFSIYIGILFLIFKFLIRENNLSFDSDKYFLSITTTEDLDVNPSNFKFLHKSYNNDEFLYRASSNKNDNLYDLLDSFNKEKIISYSIDENYN